MPLRRPQAPAWIVGVEGARGYVTPSKIFTESLVAERGIRWVTRAHVRQVEAGRAHCCA